MAEWFKAAVLKTAGVKALVGSNPTLSVSLPQPRASRIGLLVNSKITIQANMTPELREVFIQALVSRVVENAPLRELIRVYSEAVGAAVNPLEDEALLTTAIQAGYGDLLQQFNIPTPGTPPVVGTEDIPVETPEPVAEAPKKKTTRKKAAATA